MATAVAVAAVPTCLAVGTSNAPVTLGHTLWIAASLIAAGVVSSLSIPDKKNYLRNSYPVGLSGPRRTGWVLLDAWRVPDELPDNRCGLSGTPADVHGPSDWLARGAIRRPGHATFP